MLSVILISLVLLSLSIVGLVNYMRYLQLAQMDHSAKEIFLSAQNRSILLHSSQQLDNLVVQEGNRIKNVDVIPHSTNTTQIDVYYIRCDNPYIEELLPSYTIDPTLWEGDFWITYEPESGSVIDVFFCEQNLISEALLTKLVFDLELDIPYMEKTLAANRRPVTFDQPFLL